MAELIVDIGRRLPRHVGLPAVRYSPNAPYIDKWQSHSNAEGEQIHRLEANNGGWQSFSGLGT